MENKDITEESIGKEAFEKIRTRIENRATKYEEDEILSIHEKRAMMAKELSDEDINFCIYAKQLLPGFGNLYRMYCEEFIEVCKQELENRAEKILLED